MPDNESILVADEFVLFWGGWPSQWAKSEFTIDDVTYNCCEQYMMAEKARVFGDHVVESNILASKNPSTQKALGRKVSGFDKDVWNSVCRGIVYEGNLARFSQNAELGRTLLDTGRRTLVEASPRDRIWGIGLGKNNPDAQVPSKWRGRNWLGIALMQVREQLKRQAGLPADEQCDQLAEQLDKREQLRASP